MLGGEDLYREWGYVAMSRGRVENRLYVVAHREPERHKYAAEQRRRDPLEAAVAALRSSRAQTAALDVAQEGIAGMSTADLIAERARLAQRLSAVPTAQHDELERVSKQLHRAQRAAETASQQGGRAASNARSAADRAIVAQAHERARQLTNRQRGLERARPAVPREQERDIARYAAVGEELDRQREIAARAAVVAQPEYLVAELGPYPERRRQRRAWKRAANRIEAYRREFGVDDAGTALGQKPSHLRQRSAWREARREVDRARHELERATARIAERRREIA